MQDLLSDPAPCWPLVLQADGRPYLYAGWNGDVATLSALRRLGCPWDPSGETLARAVDPFGGAGGGCALPVLRWMAEQVGLGLGAGLIAQQPIPWRLDVYGL